MLERKVNNYGQEQIINNFDQIIKIGDKFLQVRLIKTKKWKQRDWKNGEFTESMPRAKFVHPEDTNFAYVVNRDDLIKLKEAANEKGR